MIEVRSTRIHPFGNETRTKSACKSLHHQYSLSSSVANSGHESIVNAVVGFWGGEEGFRVALSSSLSCCPVDGDALFRFLLVFRSAFGRLPQTALSTFLAVLSRAEGGSGDAESNRHRASFSLLFESCGCQTAGAVAFDRDKDPLSLRLRRSVFWILVNTRRCAGDGCGNADLMAFWAAPDVFLTVPLTGQKGLLSRTACLTLSISALSLEQKRLSARWPPPHRAHIRVLLEHRDVEC